MLSFFLDTVTLLGFKELVAQKQLKDKNAKSLQLEIKAIQRQPIIKLVADDFLLQFPDHPLKNCPPTSHLSMRISWSSFFLLLFFSNLFLDSARKTFIKEKVCKEYSDMHANSSFDYKLDDDLINQTFLQMSKKTQDMFFIYHRFKTTCLDDIASAKKTVNEFKKLLDQSGARYSSYFSALFHKALSIGAFPKKQQQSSVEYDRLDTICVFSLHALIKFLDENFASIIYTKVYCSDLFASKSNGNMLFYYPNAYYLFFK